LWATLGAWWSDRAMSMGASIAFYATFSLAPMLLLVIAVAGLVFGEDAARGAIVQEIGGLVGSDGASALEALIRGAASPGKGIVGTLVGAVTFVLLATGALVELQDSLNLIWRAEPPATRSGVIAFVRTRLLSLALILAIGFLLMVSLILEAGLAAFAGYLAAFFPAMPVLLGVLDLTLSLAGTLGLFALIYKVLSDADPPWRDVWVGATVTAALFAVGKLAIGAYIGRSGLASSFGAAASLIALLLWIYYSSQIVLFGAELIRMRMERRRARTANGAERATEPVPRRASAA
jgi:membrane protein